MAIRDYRLYTFPEAFRPECEGEPASNEDPAYGWTVTDPKNAIAYLDSLPDDQIEERAFRDGGIHREYDTPEKSFMFFGLKTGNVQYSPACRPYALVRKTDPIDYQELKEFNNGTYFKKLFKKLSKDDN